MSLHLLPKDLRKILGQLHIYVKDYVQLLAGPREYIGFRLRAELYPHLDGVVAVGDIVCSTFVDFVGIPRMCIVDGKTLRGEYLDIDKLLDRFKDVLRCSNPPGSISRECLDVVSSALESRYKCLILVDGEEDLLALAVVISSLDVDYVLYGVPKEGVAIVDAKGFAIKAINFFSYFELSYT